MKGVFTVSIDYEYAWGVADKNLQEADLARIRKETVITRRLLSLFEKYNIPATWAIVGGLLEKGAHGEDLAWFDGEHLADAVADSPVGHEIASHSFGHILFDSVDRETAKRDVDKARAMHIGRQFPFATFIFPRNKTGHFDVLKEAGITVFRGLRKTWYSFLPERLWTLGRGIDYWLPTAGSVLPEKHKSGLLNLPDSMLFISRKGVQKLLPPFQLVRKIRYGIFKAAERGKIFHLWFHPSNFSYDTDKQFRSLEAILSFAAELRDSGHLSVLPMRACAEHYEKRQ